MNQPSAENKPNQLEDISFVAWQMNNARKIQREAEIHRLIQRQLHIENCH